MLVAVVTATWFIGLGGTMPASAASGGVWSTQTLPAGTGRITGISCPTTSTCEASAITYDTLHNTGQGQLLRTTDGGAHWTRQTVPSDFVPEAMDCADPTHCWSVGYQATPTGAVGEAEIAATTDGTAWSAQKLVAWTSGPGFADFKSVACVTDQACWAVGLSGPQNGDVGTDAALIYATTDGGATWEAQTAPAASHYLTDISCPDASHCWAVVVSATKLALTADGGKTWTYQTGPMGSVAQIAFTSNTAGLAVGSASLGSAGAVPAIWSTADGGASWVADYLPALPSGTTVAAVTCGDATHCYAATSLSPPAATLLASADGGATWSKQASFDSFGLTSLSCPTAAVCAAGGDQGIAGASLGSGAVVATTAGTTVTPAPAATGFSDVPATYWAHDAIATLAAQGIVSGFPDGTFRPGDPVTRAAFVKMLDLTLNLHSSGSGTPFTDVSPTAWYAPYVAEAVAAGIVQGSGSSAFDPDGTVTREQMAVFLARGLKLTQTRPLTFTDAGSIDAWAVAGVEEAVEAGYLSGFPDGSFQPQGPTTRAQAAKVLALALARGAGT